MEEGCLEIKILANISKGDTSTGPHVRHTARQRKRERERKRGAQQVHLEVSHSTKINLHPL